MSLVCRSGFLGLVLSVALCAEEGMWPFNMIPAEEWYKTYGVHLNEGWLEHVQKSALRMSFGGSGSFVSPKGLVMTNHHVGSQAIYNLSTAENDLMEKGFYADSSEKELPCTNAYVDQLISIQDMTAEVNAGFTDSMSSAEKEKLRKERIATFTKKAQQETGLQPQMVTLYRGGRYQLYLYKRYTDIRLVMAPDRAIASFGGDPDNFEYPRYSLDVCFFRIYENGKPLESTDYLKWNASGPVENAPLFVAGNPGNTDRIFTSNHLAFVYNEKFPLVLSYINERIGALEQFSSLNAENSRIALEDFKRLQNGQKAYTGMYQGFTQDSIIDKKEQYERELFRTLSKEQLKPWVSLDAALEEAKSYYPSYFALEATGNYSKLFGWAKQLVRYADELKKPNETRLKEYTDSELAALELNLLSTQPVYLSLEQVLLVDSFQRVQKILGANAPAVHVLLGENAIQTRASELLAGTHLMDVEYRKNLFAHLEEIERSTDPLIVLARNLDPYSRAAREQMENGLQSVEADSYAKITAILFERYGETLYPDATFTLRLSAGRMIGYEQDNAKIPSFTTFAGLFTHAAEHNFAAPYALPESWVEKKNLLDKPIPFNFVSTNDIIGGNSGSPVINAQGEVVGLIFDGNMQSLVWDFRFDEVQGRAVSVHTQAITEALKTVYGATPLVQELLR